MTLERKQKLHQMTEKYDHKVGCNRGNLVSDKGLNLMTIQVETRKLHTYKTVKICCL